jgi:hypothetical protein
VTCRPRKRKSHSLPDAAVRASIVLAKAQQESYRTRTRSARPPPLEMINLKGATCSSLFRWARDA